MTEYTSVERNTSKYKRVCGNKNRGLILKCPLFFSLMKQKGKKKKKRMRLIDGKYSPGTERERDER